MRTDSGRTHDGKENCGFDRWRFAHAWFSEILTSDITSQFVARPGVTLNRVESKPSHPDCNSWIVEWRSNVLP